MAENFLIDEPELLRITPEHCRLLNNMLDAEAPCALEAPEDGESHACERPLSVPDLGDPGGPNQQGGGLGTLYCQEYPYLCGGAHPWSGGGIDCNWGCVEISDSLGGASTTCTWGCYAAVSTSDDPDRALAGPIVRQGFGPRLAFEHPRADARVSGTIHIRGWMQHVLWFVDLKFGVNGQEITPIALHRNRPSPGACVPPYGRNWPGCDRAGFVATFDTRTLPNGRHRLEMSASDELGWLSSVERWVEVDNPDPCAGAAAPLVAITSPAPGAQLRGPATVLVSAAPAPGVAIARVTLQDDGVNVAIDDDAPYAVMWDPPPGVHTLRAHALDGCGRGTWSSPVTVTRSAPPSPLPPAIALARHTAMTPMPHDATHVFRLTTAGAPISRAFRVTNAGDGPIALSASLQGSACFKLIVPPATTLAPDAWSDLRVRLHCAAPGPATGALTLTATAASGASTTVHRLRLEGSVLP